MARHIACEPIDEDAKQSGSGNDQRSSPEQQYAQNNGPDLVSIKPVFVPPFPRIGAIFPRDGHRRLLASASKLQSLM